MRYPIIGFRNGLGQRKKGVELGVDMLFQQYNEKKTILGGNDQLLSDNINDLYEMNNSVYGRRINIGGDHSMSIATVAHSANTYDNLKLLWIDAHGDINTPNSSYSKNMHGMVLSFLTGLTKKGRFKFIDREVKFQNILYVGLRDLDLYEKMLINSFKIDFLTVDKFNDIGLEYIDNFIGKDRVHISFDVDSLDPQYVPSTGTPVPKGLDVYGLCELFKLLRMKRWVNLDITEFNPLIGDYRDVILSKRNIEKIVNELM